jgi:hypothetical protein
MSDVSRFDFDPEDAYDATDPIDDRLDVLERIVESLRANRDERFDGRLEDVLRVVRDVDDEDIGRRQKRRLRHIRDDLEGMT